MAKFDALLCTPKMFLKINFRIFSQDILSKLLGFALKSEIHISDEYDKIGTMIEVYSFSHNFDEIHIVKMYALYFLE